MNNQEMQFADPEWRPPQQGSVNTDPREQEPYVPQPINNDPREQPRWQTTLPPEQERVYTGPDSYADIQAEKIGAGQLGQRPHGRRSPWLWLIIVLIAFALVGRSVGPFFGPHSVHDLRAGNFLVGAHPTIVINDSTGTIHVQADNAKTVTIYPTDENAGSGNPPQVNYERSNDGNTITVTVENERPGFFGSGSVDLDVTVPTSADLQVKTGSGDIEVSGVSGQMRLTSDTGSIDATQDLLSGQSFLKTDTGSVTFEGSIHPNGTYQFETNTGAVDVTLPNNSSFHLDATTDTGSITSEFSEVNVQHSNITGANAHGDVGNPPRATVTLKADTGSISLNIQ